MCCPTPRGRSPKPLPIDTPRIQISVKTAAPRLARDSQKGPRRCERKKKIEQSADVGAPIRTRGSVAFFFLLAPPVHLAARPQRLRSGRWIYPAGPRVQLPFPAASAVCAYIIGGGRCSREGDTARTRGCQEGCVQCMNKKWAGYLHYELRAGGMSSRETGFCGFRIITQVHCVFSSFSFDLLQVPRADATALVPLVSSIFIFFASAVGLAILLLCVKIRHALLPFKN